MAITITRVADKYVADVTPPHCRGIRWSTAGPMGANELIHQLLDRGCHQTDIGDAFYAADDAWLLKLEADGRA